jgi:hypothetical protein
VLAHASGYFFDFYFVCWFSHSINSIFCDLYCLNGEINPELIQLGPDSILARCALEFADVSIDDKRKPASEVTFTKL